MCELGERAGAEMDSATAQRRNHTEQIQSFGNSTSRFFKTGLLLNKVLTVFSYTVLAKINPFLYRN